MKFSTAAAIAGFAVAAAAKPVADGWDQWAHPDPKKTTTTTEWKEWDPKPTTTTTEWKDWAPKPTPVDDKEKYCKVKYGGYKYCKDVKEEEKDGKDKYYKKGDKYEKCEDEVEEEDKDYHKVKYCKSKFGGYKPCKDVADKDRDGKDKYYKEKDDKYVKCDDDEDDEEKDVSWDNWGSDDKEKYCKVKYGGYKYCKDVKEEEKDGKKKYYKKGDKYVECEDDEDVEVIKVKYCKNKKGEWKPCKDLDNKDKDDKDRDEYYKDHDKYVKCDEYEKEHEKEPKKDDKPAPKPTPKPAPKPEAEEWKVWDDKPEWTTTVVTAVTTYCPEPTKIVHAGKTYDVTVATTLTITDCPCTVSVPVYKKTSTSCPPSATPVKPEEPAKETWAEWSSTPVKEVVKSTDSWAVWSSTPVASTVTKSNEEWANVPYPTGKDDSYKPSGTGYSKYTPTGPISKYTGAADRAGMNAMAGLAGVAGLAAMLL